MFVLLRSVASTLNGPTTLVSRSLLTSNSRRYHHVRNSQLLSAICSARQLHTSQQTVPPALSPDEVQDLLPSMTELGLRPGDRVTVAMSGGVDSATTLGILSMLPIEIDVIFMRNWDPLLSESPSGSPTFSPRQTLAYSSSTASAGSGKAPNLSPCQWEKDWTDVRRVAAHLSIPSDRVRMVDLTKEYWSRVFEPAVEVWQGGGTPNPDVDCNREIKFGALLDLLPSHDRHFLATGHYACVDRSEERGKEASSRPRLFRAKDMGKDQTYYLSQMNEKQLARTILPLGRITKPIVRKLAQYWSLPNARKEESMGVCFIGERGKFGDFISQYTAPPEPGYLVLPSGERLAPHKGMWHYTIGQRARVANQLQAMYVAHKGVGEGGRDIVVVPGHDHPLLLCETIRTSDFHWIHGSPPVKLSTLASTTSPETFLIQDRHRMTPVPATVHLESEGSKSLIIKPIVPLSGVSPGQVVGIWKGDWCLGSGLIRETKCVEDLSL